MARYLERLIARIDTTAGVAAVAPQPRVPFGRDISDAPIADPFEAAEVMTLVEPAIPAPTPFEDPRSTRLPIQDESVTSARESRQPSAVGNATDVRVEHIIETTSLSTPLQPPAAPHSIPEQANASDGSDLSVPLEAREIRTESIRFGALSGAETRDDVPADAAAQPDRSTATPIPPVDASSIESSVLAKLMPALNAWFATEPVSDSPANPARNLSAFSAQASLMPPAPDPQDSEPVSVVQPPQLVIGSIHVQVTQPAAPVPPPTQRQAPRSVARASRPTSGQPSSRLSFGLGQM